MRRRLPPLNPLRAFEVAARCRSFTEAGEELNVTQAAVSRHLKYEAPSKALVARVGNAYGVDVLKDG
jgi:LysR family glycine cleavage system transcriptional activator